MSLPLLPIRLIGREQQLEHLEQLLRSHRFITLTGPGGVGKTALAIEAARNASDRFDRGAVFVPLASTRDPTLVLPQIASHCGIPEPGTIWSPEILATHLRDQSRLLLLDNLEQIQSCAIHLAALIALCPELTCLVTSRTRLNMRVEQVYTIPPLGLGDSSNPQNLDRFPSSPATELFLERAKGIDPFFELGDTNVDAVTEICRRLDGLPLAIELAAARVGLLSPLEMISRIEHRLPLLTGGPIDAPERHQTLRLTLMWSYDLLSDNTRWFFRHLSVLVGGFSLESAEALVELLAKDDENGSSAVAILEHLSLLVDNNLVRRLENESQPRFGWLETVREFAWEQLEHEGELPSTRLRHAQLMAAIVEQLRPHIEGPEAATTLARFEIEHSNIRSALAYAVESGDGALGVRLIASLWKFWVVRSHGQEGRRWIESVLVLPGSDNMPFRLEALYGAAGLALESDDPDSVRLWAEEGLTLARVHHDAHLESRMLFILGLWATKIEEPEMAKAHFETALPIARKVSDTIPFAEHMIGMILLNLAAISGELGDLDIAQEAGREANSLWQRRGDPWGLAISGEALGVLAYVRGDNSQAANLLLRSLSLFRDIGDRGGMVNCLTELGMVAARTGRLTVAARLFAASESARESVGNVVPSPIRHSYPRAVAQTRSSLGARRFESAWQTGLVLSLDDAFAEITTLSFDEPVVKSETNLLTPRELEVLRLVADGHTDQEIADVLFISYRTATSHVTNILNKLGADSRTAASTDAIRLGLI